MEDRVDMRIIAIRHGETGLNVENRLTGWVDGDLDDRGREQARAAADSLNERFDVMVSSPLLRTANTARIIAERHPCKLMFDPNLRERNFGSLSGKSWAEIESETGKDLRQIDVVEMAYDYRPYGGEWVGEVTARVREFLRGAAALDGGRDVAVVTHGGIIKMLYTLLESEGRRPITNCSVHVFHLPT